MCAEALKAFLNYPWPGNVSELMNVIERFVILVEDEEIGVAHIEPARRDARAGRPGPPAGPSDRRPAPSSAGSSRRPSSGTAGTWRKRPPSSDSPSEALTEKIRAHQIRLID